MSFWSDVGAAIAAEAKVLEADVVKALPFIKQVALATATELGQVALQSVLTAAPLLISGKEKLSTAVAATGQALANAGKAAALSDIEASVQASYNYLASTKAPGQ